MRLLYKQPRHLFANNFNKILEGLLKRRKIFNRNTRQLRKVIDN